VFEVSRIHGGDAMLLPPPTGSSPSHIPATSRRTRQYLAFPLTWFPRKRGLWRVGGRMPENDRRGSLRRALGARVGRQADELGAFFPQSPCEVVVLGLVAGGDHLFVFDVLPGESGGVVG
jgi:hypothetical protein